MAELRAIAEAAGFARVATYIQSGNLVFETEIGAERAAAELSAGLERYFGRPVGVFIRTAEEMWAMEAGLPFGDAPGNQVGCLIMDSMTAGRVPKGCVDEVIVLGEGVVYIHFPSGMGRSKLDLGSLGVGTMRNANTVRKIGAMLRAM